jgi:hypothetical protein
MTWTYEDQPVEVLPDNAYGFIYQIEYDDGTLYIGKKNCYSETQLPALKSGLVRSGALYRIGRNIKGKRVQFDVIRKENNWKSYKGSSDITKGKTILRKTILAFCTSKRELTYMECKALFCLNAIEDEKYLNINILGKFFRDNLQ